MPASTVFLAGLRQISRLPDGGIVDTMIEKGFQILVGDAAATDKAAQRCLVERCARFVSGEEFRQPARNQQGARA